MKNKKKHIARITGLQSVPVHFEFKHSTASTVCVAGTFNDWHPTQSMHSSGDGDWWKETDLAPGTYEYCLVVDGAVSASVRDRIWAAAVVFAPDYGSEDNNQIQSHICCRDCAGSPSADRLASVA